jgi:hypothetical protein
MCFMLHLRTCILGGQLQTRMHTSVVQDVASSSYGAFRSAVSNRLSSHLRGWRLSSADPYGFGPSLAMVLSQLDVAGNIGMYPPIMASRSICCHCRCCSQHFCHRSHSRQAVIVTVAVVCFSFINFFFISLTCAVCLMASVHLDL